jgi:predicted TIM-barrel enzyme
MNLLDAISEVIAKDEDVQGNVIVTGFVVLAEFTGTDGVGRIYCDTLEGQRCHSTLGLLAYGTAVETHRAAQQVLDDDD